MKYRIKIVRYKNGRTTYQAQVKKGYWRVLDYDGSADVVYFNYEQDSREQALARIDKHYAGNTKKQTIEFEYITKN